jgi:CRISPR-associated protein Cmr4
MQEDGKYPNCAGQKNHCGKSDCPICVTFGFSKGTQGSFQGLAQFSDMRLILFPVHSLAGPVWVTCPEVLKDFSSNLSQVEGDIKVRKAKGVAVSGRLNLGWLMLDVENGDLVLDGKLEEIPPEILNRTVLVTNKMFGHLVNDNLEVRTSVSIDPETGAASDGALFTYEALPRSTVLALDVIVSDPKYFKINGQAPLSGNRQTVIQTVTKGLNLFESLGIGGMSTRGMGRMRIINPSSGGSA